MTVTVADVMTPDVVTCAAATSLGKVAALMRNANVGSVVVTRGGEPYGIVTETDIVTAVEREDGPAAAVSASEVASHPLVTVGPRDTLRTGIGRMLSEGVKKLVVLEGLDVRGILTSWDLVTHYDLLTEEIRTLERNTANRSSDWTNE